MTTSSTARHRVVVLLLPPVVGFDAVIPSLLFGEAVDDRQQPLYEVVMAGFDGAAVPTTAGYSLVPAKDLSALATADTVVVPGTTYPPSRYDGTLPADVRAALATVPARARIVSICTGAFVLAAAGLLDGRPATTHWAKAAQFRALYPQVDLDENRLFVDDGDVLTSAGLAAGIDLCLHIVRRDHGTAVATRLARYCVVPPWRDGSQAQFIERPLPEPDEASTSAVRQWALGHLEHRHTVAELARRGHMSVRTFNRRFAQETGQAPGAWLIEQRLQRAQQLLETTDWAVDVIAERTGFGTGASLRLHLRRRLGTAPSTYRRTFGATTAARAT